MAAARARRPQRRSRNYLLLYLGIVIGGLNVLLSLVGRVDSVVEWHAWFEDGVVQHYRQVREFLFNVLPFHVPAWVKDIAILWSGLAFWAASAERSHRIVLEEMSDTPLRPRTLGQILSLTVAVVLLAPLALLVMPRRIGRIERAARMSRESGAARIIFPDMGLELHPENDVEGDERAATNAEEIVARMRFAFIAIPTVVVFVFLGILFVATDILETL